MKILVVDDEPSIVNLIRMNLKMEGYDVICAYSGNEAVEAYSANAPDIVLLDIMLPDMDGYDVMRAIQDIDPTAAVIFITANDKRTSKILGLELGADDYITKPFDNKEVVLRVKTLWRRISMSREGIEPTTPPTSESESDVVSYGLLTLDEQGRKVFCKGHEVSLTYREFDLLCYLVYNRKRVIKREELLEKIWGYTYMGNSRTVDILIKRLRDKLDCCGEYIKTVYGVGYKFEVAALEVSV